MSEELEVSVVTQSGGRLSMSEWDDGGVWVHLSFPGGTAHTNVQPTIVAGLTFIKT